MGVSSHRKSEKKLAEMTVERAVSLLASDDEDTLLCAAGHLQTQCFKSTDAKKSVRLDKIPLATKNIVKYETTQSEKILC